MIRFSSLGDILLTAPALRGLRARFPSAHIDLLVAKEYAAAAALLPGPNRILTFDRRTGYRGLLQLRSQLSRRYSILVDLQNSFRSAFLRLTAFPTFWVKARRYRLRRWLLIRSKWNLYRSVPAVPLRYLNALDTLGVHDDGRGLNLFLSDDAVSRARDLLELIAAVPMQTVVFCPGARHATKRWPEKYWIELGRLLQERDFRVVVIGSENEANELAIIAQSIEAVLITEKNVDEIAALFQRTAAVISNDSGLMHLAAGLNVPLIAIFGPTVKEFGFYPYRARSVVLEQQLNCRPCSAMGGARCPKEHFRCMLDTEPRAVFLAVISLVHPTFD